jgi:hypothetical protein
MDEVSSVPTKNGTHLSSKYLMHKFSKKISDIDAEFVPPSPKKLKRNISELPIDSSQQIRASRAEILET